MRFYLTVLLVLLAVLDFAKPAHAARSFDNCTGFITSLPAVVSTPGTWCLKQNLSTASTSGSAIDIQASNVVLDCNDFLLDGLAAGAGTQEFGILAASRTHVTVRYCNVRGFFRGIVLEGTTGGNVVEYNHLNQQTYDGIEVVGSGSVIRNNLITDTGGTSGPFFAYGIQAYDGPGMEVIDNQVIGLASNTAGNSSVVGLDFDQNPDGVIEGNQLRGLVPWGAGIATAIQASGSPRAAIRNNDVENGAPGSGYGIECDSGNDPTPPRLRKNTIQGFEFGISLCGDAGENDVSP